MNPAAPIFVSEATVGQLDPAIALAHGLESDGTRTYLDITLCHSYPVINKNGMTLTGTMLANRFPTANHQPMNMNHKLEGNPGHTGVNEIVGSIVESFVDSDDPPELLPSIAVPGKLIAVVWNRTALGQKVIKNARSNKKKFQASFEITFNMEESGWIVNGTYHDDVEDELKEEWARGDFSRVALAVGGKVGMAAHFFGGAFTMVPADPKSEVKEIVASFAGGDQIAIAATANQKKGSGPMSLIKKIIAAVVAQAGFGTTVSGNNLSVSMGESTIENPADFYSYGYVDSEGKYHVVASVTIAEPDGAGGFETMKRFVYNPDTGEEITEEAVASDSNGHRKLDPSTVFALISEQHESIVAQTTESVKAEFEGYISPEAHKTAIDQAVAAASKGAPADPPADPADEVPEGESMNKETTQEMIDSTLNASEEKKATAAARATALADNDLALTDSRQGKIDSFEVGEAGDKEFASYLTTLVASQKAMFKTLEEKKITANEEIKSLVSQIDNPEDVAFQALLTGGPTKETSAATASVAPRFGNGHAHNPRNENGTAGPVIAM